MDAFMITVAVGSLLLYLFTSREDHRIITKKKVVKIPMVPFRTANKCIQTDQLSPISPMSSISSLDIQFVFNETYLENNSVGDTNEESRPLVQSDSP